MKRRTPLNWFQMTWCLFSCPLLVWYLSEIQLLLLQLREIDEQDLTFWSSLSVLNPQSLVSCCLELSFPFHLQICILFIGFSTIFSLYLFFFEVCFITSILYLYNLPRKHKYRLYTRSHTSYVFRCGFTGLSLCLTQIFTFHNVTTCQERQVFSCLLPILAHITLKWSKRQGHRQTIRIRRCPFLEPPWTNCFLLSN